MTGIALGAAFLVGAAFGWHGLAVVSSAIVAALVTAPARGGHLRHLAAPAAVALLAAGSGAWRGAPPLPIEPPLWADTATALSGRVETAPRATGRWQRFALAAEEAGDGKDLRPVAGLICVTAAAHPALGLGDRVGIVGAVSPIQDEPGSSRAVLRARGCGATAFAGSVWFEDEGDGWRRLVAHARTAVGAALRRAAPGDAGALLSGFVTGDDDALSRARRDAFLATGTTHVTAVSGANLGVLVAAFGTLGAAGGWRHRLGWQLPTVAAVWGYALLVGLEAPAQRAALVASAAVFAARAGRRPDVPTLIVLAAAAMVAVEPAQLWTLSFRLSFASSLALAVVLPSVAPSGLLGWLGAAALATIAAQVATLPILLPTFGTVPWSSLPANVAIAPLVGLAFPLAALAAGLGLLSAPLGEAAALPARACADAVLTVVDLLGHGAPAAAGAPHAPTNAALTAACVLGILALSRDGRAWVARSLTGLRPAAPRTAVFAVGSKSAPGAGTARPGP